MTQERMALVLGVVVIGALLLWPLANVVLSALR